MILLSDTIPFQFMNIFYDIPGVMNLTMNVSQNIYLSLSDKWLMFKSCMSKLKQVRLKGVQNTAQEVDYNFGVTKKELFEEMAFAWRFKGKESAGRRVYPQKEELL